MLKLNYSINASSGINQIKLDDMYVSPDLIFVSGTTECLNSCSVGKNLWVSSPYFPKDVPAKVTSMELVKRNGYVRTPLTIPVHKVRLNTGLNEVTGSEEVVEIPYIEYNGNTYYARLSDGKFIIDEEEYEVDQNTFLITIKLKSYIENDKVTVNGITYNAIINNNGDLLLSDSTGEPVIYNSDWEVSGVTSATTYVEKIIVGENTKKNINCTKVCYYGHMAYIVYDDEKYYVQNFYDEDGNQNGAGVIIDDVKYECDALYPGYYAWANIYNANDYIKNENDTVSMTINGRQYFINFEPSEINGSGIIGIETAVENLPILINDRIIIQSIDESSEIRVKNDSEEVRYIYLNGKRYNAVKNLCDAVELGGLEFELEYEVDPSKVVINTIANCTMLDGSKMYFKVTEVGENGPSKLKKVEYINGEWKDLYMMKSNPDKTVDYTNAVDFDIINYDGFLIGDTKMRINTRSRVYGGDSEIDDTYEYIIIGSSLSYGLVVINTVGSNKLLCVPDVSPVLYDEKALSDLTAEILASISMNNFVVQKRNNTFGSTDLYYDTWADDAYAVSGGTSVYDLANVYDNITLLNKSSHFTLPLNLSKSAEYNLAYDDLVTNQYYEDEAEKAVNKLVDMEKDMYSPILVDSSNNMIEPTSIVFNMHFRTRDLETWKIYEDEGTYDGAGQNTNLTANFQYCNYFVSDYYPYYRYYTRDYFREYAWKQLMETPDLLGFLYFTTDDVKNKREKLRKSFLRLTYFDSKNPEKQNMLGTSTLYFDCDRVLDTIYKDHSNYHYEPVAKTRNYTRIVSKFEPSDVFDNLWVRGDGREVTNGNWITYVFRKLKGGRSFVPIINGEYDTTTNFSYTVGTDSFIYVSGGDTKPAGSIISTPSSSSDTYQITISVLKSDVNTLILGLNVDGDVIDYDTDYQPTVLNECFRTHPNTIHVPSMDSAYLVTGYDQNLRVDSRIKVTNRYNGDNSSEGFYSYILKEFSKMNKLKSSEEEVTIYMKAEFFHAGIGIKIPMIIPTQRNEETSNVEAIKTWNETTLKSFLSGYELNGVFDQLYIPIKIKYSRDLRRYTYRVSDEGGYDIVTNKSNTDIVFNLFELKIKPS